MASYPVLEHRATRTSRWLRTNRVRIALVLAVAETALIVANVLQWRWALAIAAAVFAFYLVVGRRAKRPALRQLSWTAALSQVIPLLFPILVAVAATLAVITFVVAALVVVALLFLDWR